MKSAIATLLLLFPMLIGAACDQVTLPADGNHDYTDENIDPMKDTVVIKVGGKEFTATLLDNATANAFKTMLPLTINMTELNGNEKYFRLSSNLPANASNSGTIHSGDLMLWGSNTLVLFYRTFSTSYSYSRIGMIDNPGGLAAALGAGNVLVNFEVK